MSAVDTEHFGIVYARYGVCACSSQTCVVFCIFYYVLVLISFFVLFSLCLPCLYRHFREWREKRRRNGRSDDNQSTTHVSGNQPKILRVLHIPRPAARNSQQAAPASASIELSAA